MFIRQGTTWIQSRDLSTPLPLGAISIAMDINWKLLTINPKLKRMILNLFIKTGYRMDIIRSRDLSTLLPMGAILSAIDINPKLATIYPKLKGMILNLFC